MAELVLTEEFHLSVLFPRRLPDAAGRAVRRALGRAGFRAARNSAARNVARRHPAVRPVPLRLSR